MRHSFALSVLRPVLLVAALWVAAMPLAVAVSPGLAALLPGHSHATLHGAVVPHTHTGATSEPARCIATSANAEAIVCGSDEIAAFAALLPGIGPASITAVAAVLASRLVEPAASRTLTPEVTTPPPRA